MSQKPNQDVELSPEELNDEALEGEDRIRTGVKAGALAQGKSALAGNAGNALTGAVNVQGSALNKLGSIEP